jgi:hypothetical protein
MPLVSFDLEIARPIPDNDRDFLRHRPGIACAAMMREGDSEPVVAFHPRSRPELYDERTGAMNTRGCSALVTMMQEEVRNGCTLLTWNGLGFDFAVVAAESGRHAECVELALGSIDMMFQLFCEKGYPLALDTALSGMGLLGKTHSVRLNSGAAAAIDGALAPDFWQAGEYDAVMKYCGDDARRTLELGLECPRRGRLQWTSRRGTPMELHIGKRWLDVRQCVLLPLPDTRWMSEPMSRERFTSWMGTVALA